MHPRVQILAVAWVTAYLGLSGIVTAQDAPVAPTSSQERPAAKPFAPASPAENRDGPAATPAIEAVPTESVAQPANPYAGDLFTRQRLAGDWLGTRSVLAEKGLTFDLFLTQFYQGIASGGQQQEFDYGGKVDYLFNLDSGKLTPWKGLFVDLHAETRYGISVNEIDGLLAPSNISMNFPEPNAEITSITGLKITQALSETFAVYLGKINTLDEYPIRYSPGLGTNKPGLEGFMNTSLVFNPIAARTIPYSALGVGMAVLTEGKPLFTLTAFDPRERATIGAQDPYAEGVVIVPDLVLRAKPFGLPAILDLGGTWSSAQYRSFDPAAYLNIVNQVLAGSPASIIKTPLESGSWCLYANFYQAFWADAEDEKRTWGLFGQFGISDGNPNPIAFVANGGVGGRSMLPGRTLDTFGLGYFYLGLSNNFKTLSRPFQAQQDEYGVEVFYNYALAPGARLTADLQVARPSTIGFNTAIIPGIRFQLLF